MDVCRTIPSELCTFNLSFKHYCGELRKQIRLDQADESTTLIIESLNRPGLYQHIHSLYLFVKSCDAEKDAAILDKLQEDARSLIRVINEKRNAARMRDVPIGVPIGC